MAALKIRAGGKDVKWENGVGLPQEIPKDAKRDLNIR